MVALNTWFVIGDTVHVGYHDDDMDYSTAGRYLVSASPKPK